MNPVMISSTEKHARHTVLELNHSSNYLNIKSWIHTGQQNKGLKSENDQNILIKNGKSQAFLLAFLKKGALQLMLCRIKSLLPGQLVSLGKCLRCKRHSRGANAKPHTNPLQHVCSQQTQA